MGRGCSSLAVAINRLSNEGDACSRRAAREAPSLCCALAPRVGNGLVKRSPSPAQKLGDAQSEEMCG